MLCGAECECSLRVMGVFSLIKVIFVEKLIGNRYADYYKLEKTAHILVSELWEYDFDDLLSLVKEYVHKQKLYGDDSCPSQLQLLAEDLQLAGVEGQIDGKLCCSGEGGTDGTCMYMYVWLCP